MRVALVKCVSSRGLFFILYLSVWFSSLPGLDGEIFKEDSFPRFSEDGHACSVEIIRHGSLLADSFCMVETADCTLESSEAARSRLPDIPKGSWGTCALIAPGSELISKRWEGGGGETRSTKVIGRAWFSSTGGSVLGARQGPDIDSHDTVIRIQAQKMDPKLAMDIGRRTDILITRGKINYSYKRKVDKKYRLASEARAGHRRYRGGRTCCFDVSASGGCGVCTRLWADTATSSSTFWGKRTITADSKRFQCCRITTVIFCLW